MRGSPLRIDPPDFNGEGYLHMLSTEVQERVQAKKETGFETRSTVQLALNRREDGEDE